MSQNLKQAQQPVNRTMPHSLEAEQGILGCVIVDNEGTLDAFSKLSVEDFYSPSHKTIYTAMREIYDNGSPIDFVTLVAKLDGAGKLDGVGGISYITNIVDIVPSSANFRYYLAILEEKRTRRKLINAAGQIIETSHVEPSAQAALQIAEKEIFNISKDDDRKELSHIKSVLPEVINKLDIIHRDPMAIRGLKTGFFGLDNITNGLQRSDLIILAARPSVGKTALGLNMCMNAALKYGAKVAVFSLEMSKEQMTTRVVCSVAKVSLSRAMKGNLEAEEWKRIWEANALLAQANIHFDDNSMITPAEILRKCMKIKRESGLDLVMIDYLGLMSSANSRRESRQVEVADNSRMMKIMAKELDIPVLLLSQLNRGIEARQGVEGKPRLSDLRESGAIEQDADIVMFIHKEKNDETGRANDNHEAELLIEKHRNGPLGSVKLSWVGDWTSFVNQTGEQKAQEVRDKPIAEPKPKPAPKKKSDKPKEEGEEVF
ncbi:MAG: replicative DNA helicase [Firmicutes bacterium]|nr:replicative DNA helicase [Bacillota bacterium]